LRLRDTIRAALAPKARLPSVFNLAWYELLVIFLILAGNGFLFEGYGGLNYGVQVLSIIVVAVIVVKLHGQRVQLVEALALISVFYLVYAVAFVLNHVPTISALATVSLTYFPLNLVPTSFVTLVTLNGAMLILIIAIIARRKLSRRDLGLTGGLRLAYLIPFGALVAVPLALMEYAILGNKPLIPNPSASELIGLSIVMIFFVALVEELLFRVLLQPQFIERSGAVAGILITSVLFGAYHASYGNVYEVLFAAGAGVVFGVAFYKTNNLPFVVTIHAVEDILLWGVLPFLPLALPH
jgi:uncharacterized protein